MLTVPVRPIRDDGSTNGDHDSGGARRGGYHRGIVSPVTTVTVRVPAKVNLQLAVGPVRADGYHSLVTVFQAVSLFDEVTVAPAQRDSVVVAGEGAGSVPVDGSNLAARAAGALLRAAGPGVQDASGLAIRITKRIPVAGGLAGGSADAAATLVACNELWQAGLSQQDLHELAADIGSDVAFCLLGGTAIGMGRGERLTPALTSGTFPWVLALADGGLSTGDVYAACDRIRAARNGGPDRAGEPAAATVPEPVLDKALMAALRSGRSSRARPTAVQRSGGGRDLAPSRAAAGASGRPGTRRARRHGLGLGTDLCLSCPGPPARAGPDRRAGRSGRVPGRRPGGWPGAGSVPHRSRGGADVNLVNLEKVVKGYGQRLLLNGVSAGVARRRASGRGRAQRGGQEHAAGSAGGDGHARRRPGHPCTGPADRAPRAAGPADGNGGRPGDPRPPRARVAGDPRTRSAVAALLPGIDFTAQAARLSGGESRRVALAALLLGDQDLLLLDEPTNHLDVEAVNWLARFLAAAGTALVVVTHDRWFLDAVCGRTWELADGQLHAYDGGYAAYVLARAERARLADAAQRRRRNLLRKELAWLRRGPPARTSKPRFRIEAANALIADEPAPRNGVELARLATARLGKTVIDAEDLTVRAGERVLLDDVTWQLGPGHRVGLVGPNGSGKTTLLRVLAGEVVDRSGLEVRGWVTRGKTVRLGYLAQDDAGLDLCLSAREAVAEVQGNLLAGEGAGSAGQLLEMLGLRGDVQFTPAGELSGGERRRVQVLRLLVDEPNVLLLDEPTNDLDVDTLTELEDLLDGWPGSLLVVSHDRYFLERVTDHVVALLGDGKLSYLGGGIDEYLARRASQLEAAAGPGAGARAGGELGLAGAQRAANKELQRLERQIDRLTTRETALSAELTAHASNYQRLIELGQQLRAVQTEKARLEERWLTVADQL